MGDVATGSNTPLLVSKVLQWRKLPESARTWDALALLNPKLIEHFNALCTVATTDPTTYDQALQHCSTRAASEVNISHESIYSFTDVISGIFRWHMYNCFIRYDRHSCKFERIYEK